MKGNNNTHTDTCYGKNVAMKKTSNAHYESTKMTTIKERIRAATTNSKWTHTYKENIKQQAKEKCTHANKLHEHDIRPISISNACLLVTTSSLY